MLTAVLVVIVALVALVLIIAATKPDVFDFQRSTTIKAPPEKIFPLIDDFHQWPAWSPYEKLDPAMERRYSGVESGKGAVYEWEGNARAGAGRMEITESLPPHKVTIKVDFAKPFEAHNTAEFALKTRDGSTKVTWAMRGPVPFVSKVMQVFVSMDKLLSKDFEAGLAALKVIAEGEAADAMT